MRRARLSLALVMLAVSSPVLAQEFRSAELCPLTKVGVGGFGTFEVKQPGFTAISTLTQICTVALPCADSTVNGTRTLVAVQDGGLFPGRRLYHTEDASGLRVHRVFFPDLFDPQFGFFDSQHTFSPPLFLVPASFDLHEFWSDSVTDLIEASNGSSGTLTVETTSRADRREMITVAFGGPFETVVIERSIVRRMNGEFLDSATSVNWLAPGLCSVFEEFTEAGELTTRELVNTNAVYTPEPSSTTLALASLVMLALIENLRGRESRQRHWPQRAP